MGVGYIIGSPRSGTTILGEILSRHPEIAQWYEPYYLWERYFPCEKDDVWQEKYLNVQTAESIHKEYNIFRKKTKKPIIIEKSPGHELNIKIIHNVFQDAKWIHILRDGRDVTLSIKKEWHRRRRLVKKKDFRELLMVSMNMLRRQPFWRYRIMAILYELRVTASLNPAKYLNKSRWQGEAGWGNRFTGWKKYLEDHSSLEFNAMQWVKSLEAIAENWSILPVKNKIEIRYEDLLKNPEAILKKILDFLAVATTPEFFKQIPKLKKDNFHKWKTEFTPGELNMIRPILTQKLIELGFETNPDWNKLNPKNKRGQ